MAISFVGGKPGAGKTLYAVGLIIRELLTGNRIVVTNVPLKTERLNEYLQEKAPDRSIPLLGPDSRLIVLDDNEPARELYREYSKRYYEEPNPELRESIFLQYEERIKKEAVTEQAREFWKFRSLPGRRFDDDTGALIVLDELHIHFNARKWMATGDACLHYLSQHRKLGDDVVCITQALGNVDKQFRSVAEDFTMIINESKRKLGPFKGRNRFVRASYYKEPQGNRDQPFERASFQLDAAGVASCYDTAAGVGVHGNKADTKVKAKGIPIMVVLPAAIALVAIVAGLGPWALGRATGAYIAPHAESRNETTGRAKVLKVENELPPELNKEVSSSDPVPIPGFESMTPIETPLYVSGITILNRPGELGRFSIMLSDGRTINESDGVVLSVNRNRVKLANGTELWIGRPSGRQDERGGNVTGNQIHQTGHPGSLEESASSDLNRPSVFRNGVYGVNAASPLVGSGD